MAAAPTKLPKDQELSSVSKRYADLYRKTAGPLAKLYTKEARDWFQKRIIKDQFTFNRLQQNFKKKKSKTQPVIGRLYSFAYTDPVHKETLPYYDAFPMIFPFSVSSNNGYHYLHAINLHHLPPVRRALLFDILLGIRNEKRYRDHTKLKLTYQALEGLTQHQLFAPCVKTYRTDRIDTDLVEIPAQDWQFALFLPTAKFFSGDKPISAKEAWKIGIQQTQGETKFRKFKG